MLKLGFYLFGIIGAITVILPIIFIFITGSWVWIFGLFHHLLYQEDFMHFRDFVILSLERYIL